MCGFVKIQRKITEWEWYKDANTARVFMHLFFTCNWKEGRFEGRIINPGEKITSVSKITLELGIPVQGVRTALKRLKLTNEITIETTSKYTFIKLNNYNKYNDDNKPTNKPVTNEQQTNNKRVTTIEEGKKERRKEVVEKKLFLDLVFLTEKEHTTLLDKFGKKNTEEYMERLNSYIGEKGDKYKSHYFTIRNWLNKDEKKKFKLNL